MNTTYILAGGFDRHYPEYGRRLAEVTCSRVDRPRMLSCFFALEPEEWSEKQAKWDAWLAEYIPSVSHNIAMPESFLQQIQRADVIYLHGGHTPLLMRALKKYRQLPQAWQGKIVVGSSAGAQVLSNHFLSASRGVLGDGMGIVDANVMVHYGAPSVEGYNRSPQEWEQDKARFQEYIGAEGKITLVPEGEFVIWDGI